MKGPENIREAQDCVEAMNLSPSEKLRIKLALDDMKESQALLYFQGKEEDWLPLLKEDLLGSGTSEIVCSSTNGLISMAECVNWLSWYADHVLGTKKVEQQVQAIFDMMQAQKKGKPPVSISSIKTDTWLEVQDTAKLSIHIVDDLPAFASKKVAPFGWDERLERAQADSYMPHLRQNISLGSRSFDWVDAANRHPQLLSYNGLETLGRNFRGTTDVVVADRSAIRALQPELRMRVLFKLKKEVTKADVIHAQASLLLANLHSPDSRPVMVLTDLREQWQLMWLDGTRIYQHAFTSREHAVGFIEDILAGRIEASESVQPSVVRLAKRRKIDDRLAATPGAADSAAFEEQMQSLEGMVAPSELMQMRADRLVRIFKSSPFAPSWMPVQQGCTLDAPDSLCDSI